MNKMSAQGRERRIIPKAEVLPVTKSKAEICKLFAVGSKGHDTSVTNLHMIGLFVRLDMKLRKINRYH